MVDEGRDTETKPCLDQIDAALIPSALGSRPPEVWWKFGDLDVPSDKEETDRFKVFVDAAEKVQMSGAIPDVAFAKAYQNSLVENGWMPGLEGALAEIPKDERFGLSSADDGTDPSELQAQQREGGDLSSLPAPGNGEEAPPRRRLQANDAATWLADATPRPLYVQRKLLNAGDLIAWAKANGFASTLNASDLHVTVLYSRNPVDPMKMGRDWREDEKGQLIVRPGGPRVIERLGENAVVLRFASPDLEWRHRDMVEAGGSHDWPEYAPHVTISYAVPDGVDLDALKPFNGELRFGPEIFEALDLDWKSKVVEDGGAPTGDRPFEDAQRGRAGRRARGAIGGKFDPTQPRDRHGRWIPAGRRAFIDAAAKGATNNAKQIEIGRVGAKVKAALEARGIQLKGDGVALDPGLVRHIVVRHSAERGGQRSVSGADIASAAGLLNRARAVRADKPARNGSQRFVAMTRSRGESIYSVFEVRKKAVTLVTMWKRG